MIDMSIGQLMNEIDKSDFTLYTEWQDTHFKIILLRSRMVPLSGEMYIENANYFLGHLDESFETYIGKTRRAFSGESTEIQFFLQDETLTWKEQNILTRGEIVLYPVSNILDFADTLKQSLEYCKETQNRNIVLQQENNILTEVNKKSNGNNEEIINMKDSMEREYYSKFLLLLNTKKEKIRELQKALNNDKGGKSKYDDTTEESESSESGKIYNTTTSHKSINMKKRKINYKNNYNITPKSKKKNFKRFTDSSSDESPVASTSKSKLILKDTSVHDMTKSKNLDITEDNSEEDIFAS